MPSIPTPPRPQFPFVTLLAPPATVGSELAAPLADIFGPWTIPQADLFVYSNFIVSRDGRVSFNSPGHYVPHALALGVDNDRWAMALLRARADAAIIGDASLEVAPEVGYTVADTEPALAPTLAALRAAEGLAPEILPVVLSLTGQVRRDAALWHRPGSSVVLATTETGADAARDLASRVTSKVYVEVFPGQAVDPKALLERLQQGFGVGRVICEGGPRVYAAFLAADVIDQEFLTLAPLVIGSDANHPRPTVVEGVAFAPGSAPRSQLLAVRQAGDFLFLQSAYHLQAEGSPS